MNNFELNKIYNESCLDTMKRMPDNFIDLTITSPPYDNLRAYKDDVGNDWSFETFKPIAEELFRVTMLGGVVVWVVGDATINGSESGTSFRQALYFMECGFNLHDTMIYEKNGASYPANDNSNRYSQVFEYMFVFSKGKPKTSNLIKDKKNRWSGSKSFGSKSNRNQEGDLQVQSRTETSEYGYRNNIWKYNNGFGYSTKDKEAFEHPAIFPEKLAADHIFTWSNEFDIVYDCFMGSGTTAKLSHEYKRNWIGSEISKEFVDLANKRLKPYLTQTKLF